MFRIIIFCMVIIFIALAAPVEDAQAEILNYENENDGRGNYRFSFQTSNGIIRTETGRVVNDGDPDQHIFVLGSISFTDPDGKIQKFRYTADQNGYKVLPPELDKVYYTLPNVVATLLG